MQALADSLQLFAEATNIRLIDGDELVPVATYHADPDDHGTDGRGQAEGCRHASA
jgi:hypothetical protein